MSAGVIEGRVGVGIVREGAGWVVAEKPAGLVSHPSGGRRERSLVGELEGMFGKGVSLVTRLDRETSGLALAARTERAARALGRAMMRREVGKQYLAVARGWPRWEEWRAEAPLGRRMGFAGAEAGGVWVRQGVWHGGRECSTRLVVERRFERAEGRFSLLRCFPATGRTHQIRAHCEWGGLSAGGGQALRRGWVGLPGARGGEGGGGFFVREAGVARERAVL